MPPAPPKSSGAKILLWIVGGFAALVILVIVAVAGLGFYVVHKAKQAGIDPELMKKNPALAAAKMAVTASPNVQMVASDDSAGTMVVRDKKTGKVTTLKFDAAKKSMVVIDDQGKEARITADTNAGTLQIQSADTSMKIGRNADQAPSWVPLYPGVAAQNTMSLNEKGRQSGTLAFDSKDSPEKVMSFYAEQLTSAGMKVTRTTASGNGTNGGMVTGSQDNDARTVLVTVSGENEGAKVSVTYSEKQKEQ
jgi:hypothetical protein